VNFWNIFIRLLPWRPIEALAALYWHVTRRRVRARNRLLRAADGLPITYRLWIGTVERANQVAASAPEIIASWNWRPRLSVVLHETNSATEEQLERSTRSIARQFYPAVSFAATDEQLLKSRIAATDGEFVILLRAGDALADSALFRFAEALQSHRDARILYGDQDERDSTGRRRKPWFKPRWNEEMFLAQDYLSSAVAIKIELARTAATSSIRTERSAEALVLAAVSSAAEAIVHVPHVLCHVDGTRAEAARAADRIAVLQSTLSNRGASYSPGPFETVKIEWPLPERLPRVSILIPTKDKLDLLRPCVESVLAKTDYREIELLIVDNGSSESATANYLDSIAAYPRVRVLSYPGPYNFSAINNFAAREAHGAYLCLLNNDTEVIEPAWLSEMMRYAVRAEIGAVGAKLLYEDGSIQHAGVVVGIGEAAGHAHRFLPADDPGYFRQAHVAQFASAVTAACLVVAKDKFDAVRGLDEQDLPIAFNDVDFCLKLQAAGWRNAYVPHAVLLHHESKSRGSDTSAMQIERYRRELAVLQKRWGTKNYQDPLHNPNLDRYSETFVLRL
jgi:GT2 family glycosyltransferase